MTVAAYMMPPAIMACRLHSNKWPRIYEVRRRANSPDNLESIRKGL